MSFFKKLFGGGEAANDSAPKVLGEETYQRYTIRALEMRAGSEFQLCGEIAKEIDGEQKVQGFTATLRWRRQLSAFSKTVTVIR